MKRALSISVIVLVLLALACSQAKKTKSEGRNEQVIKEDVYSSIRKIAEALPMSYKDAHDFFSELDSVQQKNFRRSSSQLFQYKKFTVFYEQPGYRKILNGVGIDLDTNSHVDIQKLAEHLNSPWQSVDLIEIREGKMHYSSDYTDERKRKKIIQITLRYPKQKTKTGNEITFISIDTPADKKERDYNL